MFTLLRIAVGGCLALAGGTLFLAIVGCFDTNKTTHTDPIDYDEGNPYDYDEYLVIDDE